MVLVSWWVALVGDGESLTWYAMCAIGLSVDVVPTRHSGVTLSAIPGARYTFTSTPYAALKAMISMWSP